MLKSKIKGLIIIIVICFFLPFQAITRANIDSLYRVYDQLSIEEKKDAYLKFSSQMLRQDLDSAFQMLDSASRWILQDETELYGRLKSTWGTYYWYIGNLDTAIYLYQNSLKYARISKSNSQIMNNLTNIGAIMNQMGLIDSAYIYLTKALQITDLVDEERLTAKVHFDLGNLYNRKGYTHVALEHLQKAIDFYEQYNDSMFLVYNYNAIAGTYQSIGDFEKSTYYFKQAISIDLARNDVNLLTNLYNNLGVTYWKLEKNYDTARYFLNKAIATIPPVQDSVMYELVFKLNLGGLEVDAGNYQEALRLLLEVSKLDLPYQDNYKVSALLINLGVAYKDNNRLDSARYYIQKGLNLAESVEANDNMLNAYQGLYELDSIQGEFNSALKNYKLREKIKDSIASESVKNRIAELEIIHKTEKKENENRQLSRENELQSNVIQKQHTINTIIIIAVVFLLVFIYLLLQNRQKLNHANIVLEQKNHEIIEKNEIIHTKNRDLEIQKDVLLELNKTKDKFFTIVAHDLKNPFNSLMGLLDILEDDFQQISDDRKLEIIKRLHKSSRNTYNMLVNLLDWAQSQRGYITAELQPVSPHKIAASSIEFLKQRAQDKEHKIENKIDEKHQVVADPHLLQTIMINMVNNAIKFTHRGGHIQISSKATGNKVTLAISDNGIGMDQAKMEELFKIDAKSSHEGTENETGTGLGLIMCAEFIKLMNGKISVNSETGKGSTFYIELPKAAS